MTRQFQATAPTSGAHSGTALRLLDGLPREFEQALARWLDALAELPLAAWIEVGAACAMFEPRAACERMESALRDNQLELTAWFIRDLVATAAHGATVAARKLPRSQRRLVSAACLAAERAALAIAAQGWLSEADRDALCAPFDRLVARGALKLVPTS